MTNEILWQDNNTIITTIWAIIGVDTSHLRTVREITQEQLADTIKKVYLFECKKSLYIRWDNILKTFDGHNRFIVEGELFNAVEMLIIANLLCIRQSDVVEIDIFDDGIKIYHNGAMATIMNIEKKGV